MRRLVAVLLPIVALFVAGCGSQPSHLWVAPHQTLTACADTPCGSYSVALRWDVTISSVTGYYIFVNGSQVASPISSPYVVQGLTCGNSYTFGIEAHDGSGHASPMTTTPYSTPSCGGGGQTLNCFSAPGACGYPDPAYNNVGVANCSTLPTVTSANLAAVLPVGSYFYSGSGNVLEVAANNVTWANLNFAGWLIYSSPTTTGLTLNTDCVSFAGDGAGDQVILTIDGSGATVENSTVFATNNTTNAVGNGIGCGASCTITNDYVYNIADAVSVDTGSSVSNNYLFTNANISGAHSEDLYMKDIAVTINHNTLLNPGDQTAGIFAEYGTANCDNQLTVTNNFFAGGGYPIYQCSGSGSTGTASLTFTGNDIAKCLGTRNASTAGGHMCGTNDPASSGTSLGFGADSHGYWPDFGFFGTDADTYCLSAQGTTWSGNFEDDNGAPVNC